jgi:hypothetical protein
VISSKKKLNYNGGGLVLTFVQFSPSLLYTIRKLIEEEGAVKIRSIIQGTSLPQHVLDLTHQYAALCAAFRSSGSDG